MGQKRGLCLSQKRKSRRVMAKRTFKNWKWKMSTQLNLDDAQLDEIAISNFRNYLKIPSVHPNVNYDDCVKFLKKQARFLRLSIEVYEHVIDKPVVVLTWVGQDPSLPSILLNSHMDVVPVFPDKWTHDPFSAKVDKHGNIYARGSQDMKCVGIQYLEAIRRLKIEGVVLKRTVHISFVPDEEAGGVFGMQHFVKTQNFKDLNVGFALDEGMASPNDEYVLVYGERSIWGMRFHCPGQAGHGSLLLDNTAGEKVSYILQKLYEFRNQEKQKLLNDPSMTVGDVTSVNVTQLKGGVQTNVVPDEFIVIVDNRIPVTVDMEKWESTVNRWCEEAGEGVWIETEIKEPQVPVTKLDESNPYWMAFKSASDNMNLKLKPQIFSGATDSRFIRELGLPAIGFSPMINTPVLLHDHDEFLNQNVFLDGIKIYMKIINNVANV